jgi:ribosome maturation factor RimP
MESVDNEIKEALVKALDPEFEIYGFECIHGKNAFKIKVFLDKPAAEWGTPNVADCENFCRKSDIEILKLAEQGKIAKDYILEVSSPGAERVLRNESEWERFKGKPMKLRYNISTGTSETIIADYIRSKEGITYWKIFQTKKDKKARNKKIDKEFEIKLSDIVQVKLYLDF